MIKACFIFFYNYITNIIISCQTKLTNFKSFIYPNKKRLFFIFFFFIFCKKFLPSFDRFLQKKFNLAFYDILDGFFFATLGLVIVKFIYRLTFFSNTLWYINLSFYLLFFIFQLQFNYLFVIKQYYIKILKILLGNTYWNFPSYNNPNVNINIYAGNIINKFFRIIFNNLILIRLFILQEIYLYLIINFILTYWLIFNNYLLITSILNLIIVISRLTMHLTDPTMKHLLFSLNYIEILKHNETYKPTWENAKIIGIWIIRSFHQEKLYKQEYKRNKLTLRFNGYKDDNRYRILESSFKIFFVQNNKIYLQEKYNQINSKLIKYINSSIISSNIRYLLVKDYNNGNLDHIPTYANYTYETILEKTKKNKIFYNLLNKKGFFLAIPFVYITNKETFDLLKQQLSRIRLINQGYFKHTKNSKINPFESVPDIKCKNPRGHGHPMAQKHDPIKQTQTKIPESSYHPKIYDGLSKLRDFLNWNYTFLRSAIQKDLTPEENKQLELEIEELKKKGIIMEKYYPDDMILMIQTGQPISNPILEAHLANKRSERIEPEALLVAKSWNNKNATYEQVTRGLRLSIDFHELMLIGKTSNYFSFSQKTEFNEILILEEKVLNEVKTNSNLIFSSFPDEQVEFNLNLLQIIINEIKYNPSISPHIVVGKVCSEVFNLPEGLARERHISNIHLVSEKFGGIPQKAIPDLYNYDNYLRETSKFNSSVNSYRGKSHLKEAFKDQCKEKFKPSTPHLPPLEKEFDEPPI